IMRWSTRALRLFAGAAVVLCVAIACDFGSLFQTTGSACVTDANCPGSQFCCSGACQVGCSSGTAFVTSVTVSTDYVPGYEIDRIEVSLDDAHRALDVNVTNELLVPVPIGQFAETAPERQHEVVATLLLNGAVQAERRIIFSAFSDVTIPVVITRDCETRSC